jgi:hypothetical protein
MQNVLDAELSSTNVIYIGRSNFAFIGTTGADVMDTIFGDKNWRFFSKTNVIIKFLHNLALLRVKNAKNMAKIFKKHPRLVV